MCVTLNLFSINIFITGVYKKRKNRLETEPRDGDIQRRDEQGVPRGVQPGCRWTVAVYQRTHRARPEQDNGKPDRNHHQIQ